MSCCVISAFCILRIRYFFFSSRRRHTICALVTAVQTCALPILTKQIKKKPGEFNYSSTGVGTSSHLSGYLMGKLQNLEITHIPYKGAEALNDLQIGRASCRERVCQYV